MSEDIPIINKVVEGHYGGSKEWNLNPYTLINAPGIPFPDGVINEYKESKEQLLIKISCKIKDANGDLLFEPLPVSYIHNRSEDNWFFDP